MDKSPQTPRYSFDTSAVIHAWRRAYPPEHFPTFWERITDLIVNGELVISEEVMGELKKKDDEIAHWASRLPENFIMEISDDQQQHLQHIMGNYPRLVDTAKGRSEGDPFVISLSMVFGGQLTIVSEENFGKVNSPKIPDVCKAEGLACIKLVELIRIEGWKF